jgi:hypothetical protein
VRPLVAAAVAAARKGGATAAFARRLNVISAVPPASPSVTGRSAHMSEAGGGATPRRASSDGNDKRAAGRLGRACRLAPRPRRRSPAHASERAVAAARALRQRRASDGGLVLVLELGDGCLVLAGARARERDWKKEDVVEEEL